MSFKKIIFNVRRGLKRILMHLRILPDHQKLFSKEMFFFVWSGLKRVLMHMRILLALRKHFFKKDTFYRLEWLKTCFDVFAHTSRPPENFSKEMFFIVCSPPETFFQKRYFLPSGVVKNVY